MAVLNLQESLVKVSPDCISAVDVLSPAVVLPKANHRTVGDRLSSWSIVNGVRLGRRIGPDGVLRDAVQKVLLKCQFGQRIHLV